MNSAKLAVTVRQSTAVAAPVLLIGFALLGSAASAAAQSRAMVTINGAYQATPVDFTDNVAFTKFVEDGDLDASYTRQTGPVIDGGVAVHVWRNLGIGVAVSAYSKAGAASVDARIPHPFFFNRDRSVSGAAAGLTSKETAVHLQAVVTIPVSPAIDVSVFGGPTWFNVTQDLVTDVSFTQTYPFNSATFSGATTAQQSGSAIGFNAGIDAAFYFSTHVGVGVMARFSQAAIDLPRAGGLVSVDAGGLQTGGGLRIRF